MARKKTEKKETRQFVVTGGQIIQRVEGELKVQKKGAKITLAVDDDGLPHASVRNCVDLDSTKAAIKETQKEKRAAAKEARKAKKK